MAFKFSINNTIFQKFSHSLVMKVIGMAISFFLTFFISRMYGASVFGLLTLSLVLVNIAVMISVLGQDTLQVKIASRVLLEKKFNQVFNLLKKMIRNVVSLGILLSGIVYFTAPWIAEQVFHKPDLTPYLQVLSLIISFRSALTIFISFIRSTKNVLFENYLGFVSTNLIILIALVSYYLYAVDANIGWIYVIGDVLTFLIAFSYTAYYFTSNRNNNHSQETNKYSTKVLIKTGLPLLLANALFLVMSWSDTFILGIFRSSEEVGVYSVCFRIFGFSTIFISAINSILGVRFAELWPSGKKWNIQSLAQKSVYLTLALTIPLASLILVFPKNVLTIFGDEFVIGADALQILVMAGVLSVACGSVGLYLQMTDREKIFQNFILIATLLNILLNIWIIPTYGIVGAAWASLITTLLWNIGSLIWILRIDGIWLGFNPFLIKKLMV